ncbi:protein TolR [Coralloluteibacterium stylophorae]|uniref:Tol-Pal system protein TolR n=1 Tax=Coralloluteibacterium stylophorae TaxID=1776034 RepID=A0A8J8AXS4_9GAMM|nr:protein TolR [Coralloluteibacterium stylophorae]MBS7456774.1 protein TolR [Coralloluteibacterium stylophorae]
MSTAFSGRRARRKLKNEINVVPYIDVMLVLLIIFMVTAPLLNLGVEVDLPQSNARGINSESEPVLLEVTQDGRYFLKLADAEREELDEAALMAKMGAFVRANPNVPVYVAGDRRVEYGVLMQGMALMQQAGVNKVLLMSTPAAETR